MERLRGCTLLCLGVAALLAGISYVGAADVEELAADWIENVEISALLEVEAAYADLNPEEGSGSSQSDIVLATVEIGLTATVTDWITGELVWLFEEDDTEPGEIDVGIIRLGNEEMHPVYFEAGRMYPPFGNFESNFITDPVVLEIGETRESAARLGALFGPVDVSVCLFNGDIDEAGDDDDNIENSVLAASVEYEMDFMTLRGGAAYATNIADSDGLTDEIGAGEVEAHVPGVSLWASLACDRFGFVVEHVAATDDFEAGELAFAGAEKARPRAWNFEVSYEASDRLSLAVKYETGDDLFDWQPEKRCGLCGSYLLYEAGRLAANLSLEYLHDEYENDDEADVLTTQLAIAF